LHSQRTFCEVRYRSNRAFRLLRHPGPVGQCCPSVSAAWPGGFAL